MANARNSNTNRIDGAATTTLSGPTSICGILWIPDGGGGVLTIRKAGGSADADNVYNVPSGTTRIFEEVEIRDNGGLVVITTGAASVLYLYHRY